MTQEGPVRVVVWDENPSHAPKSIYPKSLNGAVADGVSAILKKKVQCTMANLDEPEQGLPMDLLSQTDVLVWWGHARHGQVSDETVRRVVHRVHEEGMGFIALHSAHYSKTFKAVVEGHGHLKGGWREENPPEKVFLRVCAPWHPIAKGIKDFTIEHEEMYGAPFDVPPPLEVIFQEHFPLDGKTFPGGLVWTVGKGKTPDFASGPGKGVGEGFGIGRVFYFQPGHETVESYHNKTVHRIIANAVLWCAKRT